MTWIARLLGPYRAPAYEAPHYLRKLEQIALKKMLADADADMGEVGGNNRGPHVRAVTLGHEGAMWCAAQVADCYARAAAELGVTPPIPVDWDGRRGARRLLRNVAAAGAWLDEPHPGCVFALRRPGEAWSGHAGVVVEVLGGGVSRTAEANVGRFPARVRVMMRDFSRERRVFRCSSFFATVAPVG